MRQAVLVVAPGWVGDAVMMHSLIRRIKSDQPESTVTVLGAPFMEGLIRRMPGVDDFIANPFGHGAFDFWRRRRFGRSLKGRFDHVFVLPNSWKSALIPWFAGISRRTGFLGECRYGLLNDARRLDRQRLPRMVDRFNLLAEPATAAVPRPALQPQLAVSLEQSQAVAARLGLSLAQPVAALCVGAEYGPAKRWPAERVADLARRLQDEGHAIWLLGSEKDRPLAEAVEALAPNVCTNLCGRTRLEEAIDLMACAAIVVSNDSGLMHLAAALDKPLVAVYGSSSPDFTPPLSTRAKIVSLHLSCSPCFKRECPLGHLDCLRQLSADQVHAAIGEARSTAPSMKAHP